MKNIRNFLSENFQFLEVKFSIYLNRRVFAMLLPSHDFSCINICQVSRKMFKHEAVRPSVQISSEGSGKCYCNEITMDVLA